MIGSVRYSTGYIQSAIAAGKISILVWLVERIVVDQRAMSGEIGRVRVGIHHRSGGCSSYHRFHMYRLPNSIHWCSYAKQDGRKEKKHEHEQPDFHGSQWGEWLV